MDHPQSDAELKSLFKSKIARRAKERFENKLHSLADTAFASSILGASSAVLGFGLQALNKLDPHATAATMAFPFEQIGVYGGIALGALAVTSMTYRHFYKKHGQEQALKKEDEQVITDHRAAEQRRAKSHALYAAESKEGLARVNPFRAGKIKGNVLYGSVTENAWERLRSRIHLQDLQTSTTYFVGLSLTAATAGILATTGPAGFAAIPAVVKSMGAATVAMGALSQIQSWRYKHMTGKEYMHEEVKSAHRRRAWNSFVHQHSPLGKKEDKPEVTSHLSPRKLSAGI